MAATWPGAPTASKLWAKVDMSESVSFTSNTMTFGRSFMNLSFWVSRPVYGHARGPATAGSGLGSDISPDEEVCVQVTVFLN